MNYRFDLEKSVSRILKKYKIRRPTAGQWAFVLDKVTVPGLYINPQEINLDKLEMLLHDYVLSSYLHDQCISVHAFCRLAKISRQTLYDWRCGKSRKDDMRARSILAKLREERSISIQGALDSPSRCMGAIATLRHEYGWTGERLEDFADGHGLISADSRAISERYKAVQNT